MPDTAPTTEPTEPAGPASVPEGTLLFGYTHVSGVKPCPCADPGDYMSASQGPGPLDVVLRCWCGSTCRGRFADEAERAEFIARHGGNVDGS